MWSLPPPTECLIMLLCVADCPLCYTANPPQQHKACKKQTWLKVSKSCSNGRQTGVEEVLRPLVIDVIHDIIRTEGGASFKHFIYR